MMNSSLKNWLKKFGFGSVLVWMNHAALATSSGEDLPFVGTTQMIQKAIGGPWLVAAGITMVVVTCLMLAFGEFGDGFKKIINIVMWLSIAFSATSFISTMFGSGAVC